MIRSEVECSSKCYTSAQHISLLCSFSIPQWRFILIPYLSDSLPYIARPSSRCDHICSRIAPLVSPGRQLASQRPFFLSELYLCRRPLADPGQTRRMVRPAGRPGSDPDVWSDPLADVSEGEMAPLPPPSLRGNKDCGTPTY